METEGMRQHRDRDCREPATRGVETLGMSMAGGDLRARSSRGVGSVLTVLWSEWDKKPEEVVRHELTYVAPSIMQAAKPITDSVGRRDSGKQEGQVGDVPVTQVRDDEAWPMGSWWRYWEVARFWIYFQGRKCKISWKIKCGGERESTQKWRL